MKLNRKTYYKLLCAVVLPLSLSGCGEEVAGDSPEYTDGESEMTLSLKFRGDTRATVETGTAAESKIQTVAVYLFDGTTEDAYCIGRVDGLILAEGTSANAQTEKAIKVQATNAQVANTKGVVVVVNEPFSFLDNKPAKEKYKRIFGNQVSYWISNISDVASAGKFMMSNSNYLDASGKEMFITPVSTSNWATVGSGVTTTPVQVYVERVVSRVDFTWGNPTVTDGDTVEFLGWGLNVTNATYYAVKYLNNGFLDVYKQMKKGSNRWPGIDQTSIWNNVTGHRSYWAVDPNYTSSNGLQFPKISTFINASGTSLYCLENTMEYDYQNRNLSTCAIVVAKYLPKELDFSNDTDKSTWYIWNNRYYTTVQILQTVADAVGAEYGLSASDFVFVRGSVLKVNGQVVGYTSYKVNAKATASPTGITVSELNNDLDVLFAQNPLKCYMNGYCYYEVPIKQLADQVPWDITSVPNQRWHLGRYGVVRNHLYKLSVKSVLNPGKPFTSTTIVNTESDDIASYKLDVSVNVLKWTVRTQFVDL